MISKENQIDTGQRYEVQDPEGVVLGWTDNYEATEFQEPSEADSVDSLVIINRQAPKELNGEEKSESD